MPTTPLADIEEVHNIEAEVFGQPCHEILKTIEQQPKISN